jgi:hypothetical protein
MKKKSVENRKHLIEFFMHKENRPINNYYVFSKDGKMILQRVHYKPVSKL